MIKLIMGMKGTGKTKQLVELVRKAVDEEHGDVICIEKDKVLTYDIPYQARLVHASQYGINSIDLMRGFISGLAGFLSWLDGFGQSESIAFTVTVSADPATFGPEITKYL